MTFRLVETTGLLMHFKSLGFGVFCCCCCCLDFTFFWYRMVGLTQVGKQLLFRRLKIAPNKLYLGSGPAAFLLSLQPLQSCPSISLDRHSHCSPTCQSAWTDTASFQEFLFSLDILIFPQKLQDSYYQKILCKIVGDYWNFLKQQQHRIIFLDPHWLQDFCRCPNLQMLKYLS